MPNRIVEYGAIDDPGRDLAAPQFEHLLYISRADAHEHLVRPAQDMRGDDDIVEFENGDVGVRRLRVEDVQTRNGNPEFLISAAVAPSTKVRRLRMVVSSGWSDPYTAEGRSNTADFCSQGSVSIASHMPTLVVVGRMDEGA